MSIQNVNGKLFFHFQVIQKLKFNYFPVFWLFFVLILKARDTFQ